MPQNLIVGGGFFLLSLWILILLICTLRLEKEKDRLEYLLRLEKEQHQLAEQLIISEEQNRIANEIHDTVLQRLFAISCSTYVLEQELAQQEEAVSRLQDIKEAIDNTMTGLREAIYGISWEQGDEDLFVQKIENYVEEMRTLHQISIFFCVEGHPEKMNSNGKTALYRILCEGLNNAIRHASPTTIDISLIEKENKVLLKIQDNGSGIRTDNDAAPHSTTHGKGMRNMEHLVRLLQGTFNITSKENEGTLLQIMFSIK